MEDLTDADDTLPDDVPFDTLVDIDALVIEEGSNPLVIVPEKLRRKRKKTVDED